MDNTINISLIIPVFNNEQHLPKLFNSLLGICYEYKFEIIFIDDGSDDNSLLLITHFEELYKMLLDIKVAHCQHRGPNSSRELGVRLSKYPYIMFSDADDYFNNNYLSEYARYMTKGVDIVCGPLITEKPNGEVISILNDAICEYELWDKNTALIKLFKNIEVGNFMPCKLYRKSILENLDYSFNNPFEDYIIAHLAFEKARSVCKINKKTYHYVKRPSSFSYKTKQSYLSCIDALEIRKNWVIEKHQNDMLLKSLVNIAILDRFIRIIYSFYVSRKEDRLPLVMSAYNEEKNHHLHKYYRRNIKLYLFSPLVYYFVRKIIVLIKYKGKAPL